MILVGNVKGLIKGRGRAKIVLINILDSIIGRIKRFINKGLRKIQKDIKKMEEN